MNGTTHSRVCGHTLVAALLGATASGCDAGAPADAPQHRAEPTCDKAPAPRWVLRDKDGIRVTAMVEPRCYETLGAPSTAECFPLNIASNSSYPCVRIIDHEHRYINLLYHLETGKIEPCQQGPEVSDINQTWLQVGAFVLNADCSGPRYLVPHNSGANFYEPEHTRTREVVLAEGKMWHLSRVGCLTTDQAWVPDGPNSCHEGLLQPWPLCPMREVPLWVQELLPNPPYTMAVEHE